jgi:hypothetical protein
VLLIIQGEIATLPTYLPYVGLVELVQLELVEVTPEMVVAMEETARG